MAKKNIAVFFGGKSVESEVSVISGMQVVENICKDKYTIYPVFIDKQNRFVYSKNYTSVEQFKECIANAKKHKVLPVAFIGNSLYTVARNKLKCIATIDCAILATHGTYVEDGCLQGLLKLSGIPFTSSDVLSCAVSMDKVFTKKLLAYEGIPQVKYIYFYKADYIKEKERILSDCEALGMPVIVKPSNLGSSIGIAKCRTIEQLSNAIEAAFVFDNKIIVEKAVVNLTEYNCSVRDDGYAVKVSQLEQPVSWEKFLSFEDKYIAGDNGNVKAFVENSSGKTPNEGMAGLKRIFPVQLDCKLESKIRQMAISSFKALECSGVVRIDFLFDNDTQEIYLNEVNTIPGSLSFYLWKMSFLEHLNKLIEVAVKRKEECDSLKFDYASGILNNTSGRKIDSPSKNV